MQSRILLVALSSLLLNCYQCVGFVTKCCPAHKSIDNYNLPTPNCGSLLSNFYNTSASTASVFKHPINDANERDRETWEGLLINCTNPVVLHNQYDIWFEKDENSSSVKVGLRWPFEPLWLTLPQDSYCSDRSLHDDPEDNYDILVVCKDKLHDYSLYKTYRYLVGGADMFITLTGIVVIVIYIILRKSHKLVGWLVFTFVSTFSMYFGLSGILTIVHADWMSVQTTSLCVVFYSVVRYLQLVLTTVNFTCHFHMFLTFCKMTKSLKAVDRSLKHLKLYIPLVYLIPLVATVISQMISRYYPDSNWVLQSNHYAHGRCSPPELKAFDQLMALIIVLTLITVVASGAIIIYLRWSASARFNSSPSLKKQFVESSRLFIKLFLGSGSPVLIRFLAFMFVGDQDPLRWTSTFIFVSTQLFTAVYYLFVFGLTANNLKNVQQVLSGKQVHVITSDSKTGSRSEVSVKTHSSNHILVTSVI